VHPVVPWDGDDWSTMGTQMMKFEYGFPRFGLDYVQSDRMFCRFFGCFSGYIAAFVIYPWTNDYVMSFVIVNAFFLALTITVSVFFLYRLIKHWVGKQCIAMLSVVFYLLCAFLIFKTESPSAYLFWQYNHCVVYFYTIPSYLSSSFAFYLVDKFVMHQQLENDFKFGVLLLVLYVLIFSFLPAALLIAAISFVIIVLSLLEKRNVKQVLVNCRLHLLALVMFIFKFLTELSGVFGSGYFSAPEETIAKIKSSLIFWFVTFTKMNKLFLAIVVAMLLGALICKKKQYKLIQDNGVAGRLLVVFGGALFILWVYFIAFGVVALNTHLVRDGLPARMDTLYVFYFLVIAIVVVTFVYLLQRINFVKVICPVILFLMFFSVICPKYAYSDSHYMDTTPKQRYETMTAIIMEVQSRDKQGESTLTVHMPPYRHYMKSTLSRILYIHNITDKQFKIYFMYDENNNVLWFE